MENIINEVFEMVFAPGKGCGGAEASTADVDQLIERILNGALLDLGFGDPRQYTRERIQFAAQMALALLAEVRNTADVMEDIDRLKAHLRVNVSKQEMEDMRTAAGAFMEDLAPIAALLALNQLSLEGIFR